MKISAVLNTYNASKYLREVLESLTDFDEILVCDMESTDETVEIAREYGCRVISFPKNNANICEPARDFAIHKAENEWVLVVDADEIVTPQLREYLYGRVAETGFKSGLLIPRLNTFLGSPATGTPDYQLRFFPRDKTFWPPVIHARPVVDGPVEKITASRRELYLRHLDDASISSRISKINRYTDNELPKRMSRHNGIAGMLFRPAWFFIRSLVIGGGWRDGRRGIIKAYMDMIYQSTLIAKIEERSIRTGQ